MRVPSGEDEVPLLAQWAVGQPAEQHPIHQSIQSLSTCQIMVRTVGGVGRLGRPEGGHSPVGR